VREKSGRKWTVRQHQLALFTSQQTTSFASTTTKMARIRHRFRGRLHTPPIDLKKTNEHAGTPQRSAVHTAKQLAQKLKIHIPKSIVQEISGIPERSQSRILTENHVRTLHNLEDSGPDP
jgi:hypothetical protein